MTKHGLVILLLCMTGSVHLHAQSRQQKELLEEMTSAIQNKAYTGINSILISVGNLLRYEKYFDGYNRDSLHDSRSSFKSVTSLLTGIALDQGLISSTNQKVYPYFPEYTLQKNDPRKAKMTIQNLLDMRSGFDCEEFNDTKDCETAMTATPDWVRFALNCPMKDEPGTVFSYTSCDPMILSGIIAKSAKQPVMQFADKYLFAPLGIAHYRWTVDPVGHGMTAGSFYIRPLDMLKIGQLVKDEGRWQGRQIISRKWIRRSTVARIPIPDFSFARQSRSPLLTPQSTTYGDYWYRETLKTPALQEDLLFASGNGGQLIVIVKRLDMVVVFTQSNYGSWKAKRAFEMLGKYILPAFEKINASAAPH